MKADLVSLTLSLAPEMRIVVTRATFPLDLAARGDASERRLSIAIAISVIFHALVLTAFRGLLPTAYTLTLPQGGIGSFQALQAVLAGPPTEPKPEEPVPLLEPVIAINPKLVLPPAQIPVQSLFGRTQPATALPSGGAATPGAPRNDISVAVGTLSDPALLGPSYVAELAQRFPNPAQKLPLLLGAPVVDYPRAAIERGLQGRFAAVVALDALGRVTEAKLVAEDALFGPAMLDALKHMEFSPAQDGGAGIPYWAIVEFVFTIGRPGSSPSIAQAPSPDRGARGRRPGSGR